MRIGCLYGAVIVIEGYPCGCCGTVHLTQLFAPTSFIVTFEGEEDEETIQTLFEREEATGNIIGISAPPKTVVMANHQVSGVGVQIVA